VQVSNSLILHFLACNAKVCGADMPHLMLKECFIAFPHVDNIFWICPASAKPPAFISGFISEIVGASPEIESLKKSRLFVISRAEFLPQLLVREARVEDNDDLLPILRNSNPDIVDGQEEFFLADLIQSQDDRNKIFVGVGPEKPVGMLATSLDVNASLLARVFELGLFTGLIHGDAHVSRNSQLIVFVVGDAKSISDCKFRDITVNFGGNFVDINTIDMTGMDAGSVVNYVLNLPLSPSSFTVVVGYPRSEADSIDLADLAENNPFSAVVLELSAAASDGNAYQEAEDDAEEAVLDAIETLRAKLVPHAAEGKGRRLMDWCKIDMTVAEDDALRKGSMAKAKVEELMNLHKANLAQIGDQIESSVTANAFAITLFCIEEGFESRSEDILRVAFEEHPGLNYCLLMLPNDSADVPLTSCMTCPRIRPGVSFDQSLYLVHRDYLLAGSYLTVSRYEPTFAEALNHFISSMDPSEGTAILADFEHSLKELEAPLSENPSEGCFIATIQGIIVGAMSVSRRKTTTDDIHWLRRSYNVDDVVSFERHRSRSQAMITHWVMNPIFTRSARFFLREVMRFYYKSLLYMEVFREFGPPCAEALLEMIPVRPTQRLPGDASAAGHSESALHIADAHATPGASCENPLFIITKYNLSLSKTVCAKRVVVVGGNSAALSILETLCFAENLFLTNIFYVTETDNFRQFGSSDEGKLDSNNFRGQLSVRDVEDPTRSYLDALGIANRVVVITGRLTDIDRKSRAVVISDDVAVEYDVLIIASASQGKLETIILRIA
jgi:hypothetical protein